MEIVDILNLEMRSWLRKHSKRLQTKNKGMRRKGDKSEKLERKLRAMIQLTQIVVMITKKRMKIMKMIIMKRKATIQT